MINYKQLAIDCEEGNEDPLKALVEITKLLNDVKEHHADIKDMALEEATKHPKTFELHGCKFEQKNGRATYSYKHIPAWIEANTAQKAVEAGAKEAYNAIAKGLAVFSQADGSEIEPAQVTYSKDVLTVKLPK